MNAQRKAGLRAKHLAQGVLAYPRENAVNRLTWLADAVRPADDVTRFGVLTGGGTPLAGLHGELLLIRASVEATIGWDFGPKAIVEDAQLALSFCSRYRGRSDWFSGHCYGASPATVRGARCLRETPDEQPLYLDGIRLSRPGREYVAGWLGAAVGDALG